MPKLKTEDFSEKFLTQKPARNRTYGFGEFPQLFMVGDDLQEHRRELDKKTRKRGLPEESEIKSRGKRRKVAKKTKETKATREPFYVCKP